MGAAPLDGIRVLEAGGYVSGPYAGQMLADLGAEVVKIEPPPDGDPFRRFNRPETPVSPVFANCNRGKRSIAPDLKTEAGRSSLLDLVARSDVWLSNWRTGVAERLGLGDDVLVGANPRLIRVYVTGHGGSGPRAADPVFDTIVQATSGLTDALARTDRPVLLPGFPVDKVTAMMAGQSILAALFARERTGRSERIDLSMLASAAYSDFVELFANRTFVDHQPDAARNDQATGLRALPGADGWLVLAPVSGSAIRHTCEVAGHPEWAEELRHIRPQSGVAKELFDRLEQVLPSRPVAHWIEQLAARDVPVARCLTMDEHLSDDQVGHEQIYELAEWPGYGRVRVPRYPAVFASTGRLASVSPPPEFGGDDRLLEPVTGPGIAAPASPGTRPPPPGDPS
ncbi:MAG TPA: CoA transferase [Acidimicrobiales bacterium]|jgi:crotonobetainyl-CoA:carnitine CoA-transferase CaiB-like acyl-CoA transferase|nr:CoA transferase [Acidimicrobiales bacterium]